MGADLRNESDVKEYIENLGTEYRFGCFSEKRPEVCHLLGDYLEGIKKDFDKASKVYRSNCDDYGYARSCFKFGNYSFLGKGSGAKPSPADAFKYYEKGCQLKDADCCLHSGLILVSRTMQSEVERNVVKGLDYLTRSCEMNNATACFYLSGMHISGVKSKPDVDPTTKPIPTPKSIPNPKQTVPNPNEKSGKSEYIIEKDMEKAFTFAYKACELKNMYACANLSQMYARGDGIEKSEAHAEKYKKMAVEMQDEIQKQQRQLEFQQGI